MKILHTSDWHLGMPAGTDTYEDCQRFFLGQLYSLIEKEHIEAVICAGDVYDSSVSNPDAIGIYNEACNKLCLDLGVTFIVIAGNHDGAARLASCSELLKKSGLYVSGRISRDVEPVLLGDGSVAVYPLPFFTKDAVISLYPEKKDSIRSYEDAVLTVTDNIRETMDSSRFNIAVSHSLTVDAELCESDRAARIGMMNAVSKDVFRGFDYTALGHIHKPQAITDNIRYSGSPVKYSFGNEELQSKGVVVIDTEKRENQFFELPALRGRRTVTDTYENIAAMPASDDYMRIYITDRYSGPELAFEMSERFPHMLELYGKRLEESADYGLMTIDKVRSMDELQLMKEFFAEIFKYEPTPAQVDLFRDALEKACGEGSEQ